MVKIKILPTGEVSFSETWPARRVEWLLASCLLLVGVVYGMGTELFATPLYLTHSQIMPRPMWATGAFVIAGLRLAGLYINGTWRRSPHLRSMGAFLSCFAWFELSVAVLQAPILGVTVAIWPVFLAFDVNTTLSAAAEAARSDVRHRQCNNGLCGGEGDAAGAA